LFYSTDINDHKLLEKKLKEAHDAAQKSTESKTRFLSNMSHEIRTPLIGITGMLNFLIDTELTAEQMDYVHTIQQSAESLLVVINDILDLSKVEAGMMKLEWEPFSLVTMIEDANELLSTLAIQKDLELSFWVDDNVPDVVVGDRVRLRQVMLNLIGNAIKFTAEGEVFTKCTVQRDDRDESELTLLFEVVDTGAGFDANEESVMFKPFSQVDSSSTRKHGGSGLGLVISRQLVELHGGTMKCKSEKGKGSTFYFTVKFGIPTSTTKPLPQTPKNDTNNDPFFRSNGYGNNNTAQAINVDNQQGKHDVSPLPFVNSSNTNNQRFIPSPAALGEKHSQSTNNDQQSSPAEILQDVLMTKAASMQLKPPPVRNNPTAAAMAAVAKAATAATTLGNQMFAQTQPSSHPLPIPSVLVEKVQNSENRLSRSSSTRSNNEPRIPTISSGSSLSSSRGVFILPPRTPTSSSPLRALIVSHWDHSRESMVKHVKSILDSLSTSQHYQVDALTNQIEATEWLTDPHTSAYDYIMINLPSEQQILSLTRAICGSLQQQAASVLVVTTPRQRSLITESAKGREDQVIPNNCGFVFKPLKRTKLRWYFGVRQQQMDVNSKNGSINLAASVVSTPDTPYRRAAAQKEVFRRMELDVGGKGFRVLLVEGWLKLILYVSECSKLTLFCFAIRQLGQSKSANKIFNSRGT
jgi:nitrogen-specific signal transduction histidine kinase